MEISKTWTELKALQSSKTLHLQYEEMDDTPPRYFIFAEDGQIIYVCKLLKGTEDATDFETNYKANCNEALEERDADGKPYVRAESRPLNCTTYFTTCGDEGKGESGTIIGGGNRIEWDFSNDDDEIDAPSGFKRKRIELGFCDTVYIKEGTVYYMNAVKGSYMDFYVVCPTGGYYYTNDGTPTQATEDTVIAHYMIAHPIQGDVPMGDELNTESCSSGLPNYFKFWCEITVPNSDETSNGSMEMEIYRERTVIL